jgi:hypothetical protein
MMTRIVLFCEALLFTALAAGSMQAVALASMSHDSEVDSPELRLERSSGTRFIALHFDNFRCENRNVLCTGNECLHQVYVRSGSSFRLALSIRAVGLKITKEGDMASLEVTTAGPHPSKFFYRWDGNRFVKTDPALPNPR